MTTWIVFDIDGVLIDVSQSFDDAVRKTVNFLLNDRENELSLNDIRKLREKGVFGDDFKLTESLIIGLKKFDSLGELVENFQDGKGIGWVRREWDAEVEESKLVRTFNSFYLGKKYEKNRFDLEGLWRKEKPIVRLELLRRAEEKFKIGVVTGRDRLELDLAEDIIGYEFDEYVTRDTFLKPDPRALKELVGEENGVYVGDTSSDQLLVDNYNSRYEGNFEFIKIGLDVDTVNDLLDKLLKKKGVHPRPKTSL
ncbi:MAG: hydrolase [Candidatus Thermoplasmatota archaeon]|nr:hydrolase [Candidatus Thermoplasmatota archaeon]